MNLWCPDDVSRILAATEDTLSSFRSAIPSLDPDAANAYHLGFRHALQAVAIAFGLKEPAPPCPTPSPFPRPSWSFIDHSLLDPLPANSQYPNSPRPNPSASGLER